MFDFLYNHVIAVQAAGAMSLASVVIRPMVAHSLFEAITFAADIYGHQLPSDTYTGEVSVPGATRIGDPFPSCIDNPATLHFLQTIGRSGHIVDARVFPSPLFDLNLSPYERYRQYLSAVGLHATMLYILCPTLTVIAAVFLGCIQDRWAFGVLITLVISRLINLVVARRRSIQNLSGEPGGKNDLLIRLSQDRWIRLRGTEVDLRTVVARQELRTRSAMEAFAVCFGTVLALLAVALSPNISPVGCWVIVCLVFFSSISMALRNSLMSCLQTLGRVVRVVGQPTRHEERLTQGNTGGDERGVFVSLMPSPDVRRGEDVA
ncbi:hypothetical protein ARMSODRAFT_956146 [Armillaria solidipes]|uniref:Uncharacterized protein n=1 Tax=Armillaria solidipes TaxID=1076256 RepID=A0A2H3BMF5_9AGAR|nr:hypothetical protein ARMSODRAFT_956146 [Armillaria solidipes]